MSAFDDFKRPVNTWGPQVITSLPPKSLLDDTFDPQPDRTFVSTYVVVSGWSSCCAVCSDDLLTADLDAADPVCPGCNLPITGAKCVVWKVDSETGESKPAYSTKGPFPSLPDLTEVTK